MASPVGLEEETLTLSREFNAARVRSVAIRVSSSEGRAISDSAGRHPRRSECLAYTFLLELVPPVTTAS